MKRKLICTWRLNAERTPTKVILSHQSKNKMIDGYIAYNRLASIIWLYAAIKANEKLNSEEAKPPHIYN